MLASITDIRETRFVLQPDLRILPVTALSERVRASLECDDGDFAVARPRSRRPASIVDPATAALLEEFRRPSRLVDAVLRFGRARGADPEPILDQAFAILCRFCHSGLLVPEGSEEQGGIQPSFAPGQELDGFEVLRLVHLLDDTELYQARSAEGALVALKIHRPDPSAAGAGPLVAGVDAIDREAAILARLGGRYAPALVATGAIDGRPYIAAEWRPGTSIAAVADELRGLPTARGRGALLDLCRRVLAAYQFLHAQGVIHGDVHPGNLLADADGSITLIDFGASRLLDPDSPYRHAARTGVGYYCDPGAARALLAGRMPPPASAASDQYALAVLLYRMLAGGHPVDFRAEQDELMRQVLHARPLPFARRGAEPWPEVERILVRALRKQPARRFESVAAFRRALIVVGLPGEEAARPARAVASLDRVGAALARIMVGSPLFAGGMPSPPIASVWSGGGGVAWFAYRVAGIRGDGPLLALADAWAARSLDAAGDPRAFASAERGITPERVAAVSPFHSIGGLHAVAALIARARGDAVMQREQVERFV
ncbi:MAG TPA: protein kinase, partial [Kofleriaceae bacterium]|nr:protein kinase [Kofleriaceae bacterium]